LHYSIYAVQLSLAGIDADRNLFFCSLCLCWAGCIHLRWI